jgi:hypothetical protein
MASSSRTVAAPTTATRGGLSDLATFATVMLAGLSAAAGGIHGGAFPEHAREYWAYGAFFAGSAVFQVTWAFFAIRSLTPNLLRVGALANASFVALWFVTRTVGLPVGPMHWTPERVGFVDAVTVAFEIAIVVISVRLLRPGAGEALKGRTTPRFLLGIAAASGVAAILALSQARDHAQQTAPMPGQSHVRPLLLGTAVLMLAYAVKLLREARPARTR